MEDEISEEEERVVTTGVPRGSPFFLHNTVSHLSSIPDFRSSFLTLLQDLETHLSLDSPSSSHQYDLSTDSIKIYTEEELTSMAMKEAFPDKDDHSQNQLEQSLVVSHVENPSAGSSRTRKGTVEKKPEEDNLSQNQLEQSLVVSHPENPSAASSRTRKRKRTVKKKPEASLCDKDDYLAKVEELAKIKQKQEEEKADVRLHCFRNTCENGKDTSPESLEQMQSLKHIDTYTPPKPSDIQGHVDELYPEVILCVEISNSRKQKFVQTQEFLVLGRQMLSELKDKIHCITDQVMRKAGTYDHSGYFLVEDVFYNDLRHPSATDYSKPILDWLWNSNDEALAKWQRILTGKLNPNQEKLIGKVNATDLPRFESAHMQSTRFCDLRFRLGANYIYCHQGDCKHKVVIRDMRMTHPEDVKNRAAYPRLVYQLKERYPKCSICNIHRAAKMAVDVKWASENPCYFCDVCYAELSLDEESLNRDFPVYDYVYELYQAS